MIESFNKIIRGNQDENFALILKELAEIKTGLEQQSHILDAIRALDSRIGNIESAIGALQARIMRMADKMMAPHAVAPEVHTAPGTAAQPTRSKPVESPRHPASDPMSQASAHESVVEVSATFYAKGNSDGILTPVPEDYADMVPFVVTAVGDRATVKFNNRCVARLLPKIESQIIPYFNYEIKSNNPSSIYGENEVTATRAGNNWKLDSRIKIIIS